MSIDLPFLAGIIDAAVALKVKTRNIALDRTRTFSFTLAPVLLHHAVIPYTYFRAHRSEVMDRL